MLRHEIRPGRAVAGIAMLALAAGYAADAAGRWDAPWTFFFPVFFGGLGVAALTTWVSYRMRRRRAAEVRPARTTRLRRAPAAARP